MTISQPEDSPIKKALIDARRPDPPWVNELDSIGLRIPNFLACEIGIRSDDQIRKLLPFMDRCQFITATQEWIDRDLAEYER